MFAYCGARTGKVGSTETLTLDSATDLSQALLWGEWVVKLNAALGGPQVKAVIPYEQFRDLLSPTNYANDFIAYVRECHPVLETPTGTEVWAFVELKKEGGDYKDYTTLLPEVRNYHKFKKSALEQVKTNKTDRSKSKPLTLVLHACFDHNGAFHRHEQVTAVLTNTNILTLLYENLSEPTLESLKDSELRNLAYTYGKDNKITQVMLAGHGNCDNIQLGGESIEIEGGEAKEKNEKPLVLDRNYSHYLPTIEFWEQFLAELEKHLGDFDNGTVHFNRTLLLRACLTNSNSIGNEEIKKRVLKKHSIDLNTANPLDHQDKIKEAIRDYIRERGSVASLIKDKYPVWSVIGANASINPRSVGAVKPSGELSFVSLSDPKVGGSKIEYVAEGIEPLGVMRAVVECWAKDEADCKAKMAARLTSETPDTWAKKLIHLLFELSSNELKDNLMQVNQLTDTASTLSECIGDSSQRRVGVLQKDILLQTYYNKLLGGILSVPSISADNMLLIVFYEYWMLKDSGKEAEFLNALQAATYDQAQKLVDFSNIGKEKVASLLALSPASEKGKVLLAVLDIFKGSPAPASVQLIRDKIAANSNSVPDMIKEKLGGHGESDLLNKVGLLPNGGVAASRGGSVGGSGAVRNNNVNTTGGPANDAYVEPIFPTQKEYTGFHIFGRAKRIRQSPQEKAPILESAYELTVIGQVKTLSGARTDWYAVKTTTGKVGYVRTRNLRDSKSPG